MSLKSKIEAVIYAAEEPVTLAQLAALFSAEALEYKAEREAAAAEAAAESEPQAGEASPLLDEGFAYLGLEQTPAFFVAPAGEEGGLPVVVPGEIEIQPEPAPSWEHPAASEPAPELAAAADTEISAASTKRSQPRPTLPPIPRQNASAKRGRATAKFAASSTGSSTS